MKKIIYTITLLVGLSSYSQQFIPYYNTVSGQVSSQNVYNYLVEFENLGVKRRGTTALQNTLDWLKAKYLSYGYTTSQLQEFSYPNGIYTCKNLVVTKVGTVYPNKYVIICGHYDTITGKGTNDNGSGVVTILEVARLLQNIPTEYSIKFINFSGEEDGLIGSQHFVSNVVNGTNPKMDIKLVFNIDEVGGRAGMINNTITCERDTGSPTTNNEASNIITNELMTCVSLYSPLNTYLSYAYASDYMPFEDNNEVITGFFETNVTPHRHTVNDLLINMDPTYVYNVAKAATGAMMHFSVASTSPLSNIIYSNNYQVSLYPNPATEVLQLNLGLLAGADVEVKVVNLQGKTVRYQSFTASHLQETLSLDGIASGLYLVEIVSGTKRVTQKIVVR